MNYKVFYLNISYLNSHSVTDLFSFLLQIFIEHYYVSDFGLGTEVDQGKHKILNGGGEVK